MTYDTSAQKFFSVPSFVVAAQLARDGDQVQATLASVQERHFDALVASTSLILFAWLTLTQDAKRIRGVSKTINDEIQEIGSSHHGETCRGGTK